MKRPSHRPLALALAPALALAVTAGCSAQNHYVFPQAVQERYLITTGDTDRPYQSLGLVQLTRRGANLFGFVSVVDADLQKMFGELLIQEIQRAGADGIINVHFHETQYTLATKILFAFPLFFVPLPTQVQITGELVRFLPVGAPPPG